MTPHLCTPDTCGYSCIWEDDKPIRSISVRYGDAGTIDGEGPCPCEEHDE